MPNGGIFPGGFQRCENAIMKNRTGRLGALLLAAVLLGSSSQARAAVDVLERSYNAFRTGAVTSETVLTPANVVSSANQFHRRFVMSVDGKIEGSPLYALGDQYCRRDA